MTQQPVALSALMVVLVSVTLSACGIAGGTSHFVVPLELNPQLRGAAEIRVASAGMDVDPAYLNTVGVFPWGKFDAADLRNIEVSLRDTIARSHPTPLPRPDARLELHLVIRRYVVSATNTGGAVLACVAWAATTPEGTLIFAEQFYASHVVYLIGTLGLLKDEVHRAIVGRIATTALALAADPAAANRPPIPFENTATSLDGATARLPRMMVSMGVPLGPGPIGLVGILIPSGMMTVQWEVATPSEKFDWGGYLQHVYHGP